MNIEESVIIQKYEMLLYSKQSIYFDVAEFDIIVSHYLYEGKYLDALEALIHAEECHPGNTEIELHKIKIMICLEDYEKALELIQQVEDKFPEYYELNISRGQIYLAYDDISNALKEFTIAFDKNTEPEPDTDIFDIPDFLIEQNYLEEALLFLHRLIDEQKADALMYYQTAYCYDKLLRFTEAEMYYEKSLDEDPFDDKTWIALGLMHLNIENWDRALDCFEFALSINEDNYIASLCKSNALMQLGDYDQAIDCIREILKVMPDDSNTLYCLGGCYEKKNDFAEAEKCYLKAIESEPYFSLPYWGLSKILYNQQDFEGAIKTIDKAIEYEPNNEDYTFFRGQCLINLISNRNILNSLFINEDYILDKDAEIIYKQAVFFYEIGDVEQCCKLLVQALDTDYSVLDVFFEKYPEAKDDAYIINYMGRYFNFSTYF